MSVATVVELPPIVTTSYPMMSIGIAKIAIPLVQGANNTLTKMNSTSSPIGRRVGAMTVVPTTQVGVMGAIATTPTILAFQRSMMGIPVIARGAWRIAVHTAMSVVSGITMSAVVAVVVFCLSTTTPSSQNPTSLG
jgi:hypothetical protein